jgi:hypothetical protein
MQLTNND